MHITSSAKLVAATVLAIFAITLFASGQSSQVAGTWDATVTVNNVPVPFRIEIDGSGADVHSCFFNGDDRVNPSNSGSFQNGALVLTFDSYATKLEAILNDGTLTGTYGGSSGNVYPFQAKRHDPSSVVSSDQHAPDISGLWEIQVKSPKGESAWHFVVNQKCRAVKVYPGQYATLFLGCHCSGSTSHGMTDDSDFRHINVTVPESVGRIHFLYLVENISHIYDEHLFVEPADRNTLGSSISVDRPIWFGLDFMSIREHCYQGFQRVIGCRHDEPLACQFLRQNRVGRRHDTGAMFQENKRKGSANFYR
jgi:hypothetical protein